MAAYSSFFSSLSARSSSLLTAAGNTNGSNNTGGRSQRQTTSSFLLTPLDKRRRLCKPTATAHGPLFLVHGAPSYPVRELLTLTPNINKRPEKWGLLSGFDQEIWRIAFRILISQTLSSCSLMCDFTAKISELFYQSCRALPPLGVV
ncbi:hypothetical protein TB2_006940 [Malus domestica]